VIGEQHPFYLGIYEGAMGRESVRRYVETSDCVIMLGAFLTDINLGIYTAQLDPLRSIYVTSEKLSIRYHNYEEVGFADFLRGLAGARLRRRSNANWPKPGARSLPKLKSGANVPLTVKALFERLNHFIGPSTVVVSDVGDALFGATDLFIRQRTEFLSPAYYTSMGFAVPASVGVQLARPELRPLVLVGDGAFHMTGMELSTAARCGLNPIVVVLNNHGYGTERHMQDGPYNDLWSWNFSRLPDLLGAGQGFVAETEQEFGRALDQARDNTSSFSIIDARLPTLDRSAALHRLAARMGRRLGGAIGNTSRRSTRK